MHNVAITCHTKSELSLRDAVTSFVNWIRACKFSIVSVNEHINWADHLYTADTAHWLSLFRSSHIGIFESAYVDCEEFEDAAVRLNHQSGITTFRVTFKNSYIVHQESSGQSVVKCSEFIKMLVERANCYLGTCSVAGFSSFPYYNPAGKERLVSSSPWYAIPWPQWINYYSGEVIEQYGPELLLSAPWGKIEKLESGFLFLVTDHLFSFQNFDDCLHLTKVLEAMQYNRRFVEQSFPKKGTIRYQI